MLVGWLLNVPLNTLQVILGTIKPVSRRDQAWIPSEPLHHVTIIPLIGNRVYAWHKVPNVTNPICWTCENCSYKCAADCEHCVTQSSTEQFWWYSLMHAVRLLCCRCGDSLGDVKPSRSELSTNRYHLWHCACLEHYQRLHHCASTSWWTGCLTSSSVRQRNRATLDSLHFR